MSAGAKTNFGGHGPPLQDLLFRFRFRSQSFFLHLAQNVAHVVHFVPDLLTHINGRLLLGGHGDAIARPAIQLDNLFLLQLVWTRMMTRA